MIDQVAERAEQEAPETPQLCRNRLHPWTPENRRVRSQRTVATTCGPCLDRWRKGYAIVGGRAQ